MWKIDYKMGGEGQIIVFVVEVCLRYIFFVIKEWKKCNDYFSEKILNFDQLGFFRERKYISDQIPPLS